MDGEIIWPNYRRQFEAVAETKECYSQEKTTTVTFAFKSKPHERLPTIPKEKQKGYDVIVSGLEIINIPKAIKMQSASRFRITLGHIQILMQLEYSKIDKIFV